MSRSVAVVVRNLLLAAGAYLLLRLGEAAATGGAPSVLTINAFLFLLGLGVLLKVLSPPPMATMRARFRW